ncbi:MAG: hypothetical protein MJZ61_04820 [Bacteroidales bacterium]|nr:hypothetical protein [Bacteroidales bacterium]
MKNKIKIYIMAALSISLLMSSCIVTKKRYDTAVANGKKSLDSLNRVFNETVAGFNNSMNTLKANNAYKDLSVDSLMNENQKLTGDKATLNQNLISAINDYNEEKQRLVRKSRTVDSLMSIIEAQKAREDSLANTINN